MIKKNGVVLKHCPQCGSGRKVKDTSGLRQGSLFLFARQVRFFETHGLQNQTPVARSLVKTNYSGVKRDAQCCTENKARFSALIELSSGGQERESH